MFNELNPFFFLKKKSLKDWLEDLYEKWKFLVKQTTSKRKEIMSSRHVVALLHVERGNFHFKGKWRSNWKKQGMHHFLLVESCLVVDSAKSWWIDFKASDDIYNSSQGFQLRRRLKDKEMNLALAFQARIVV